MVREGERRGGGGATKQTGTTLALILTSAGGVISDWDLSVRQLPNGPICTNYICLGRKG